MAQIQERALRKAPQWRRWIEQWRESGLSVRAFCARHNLTEPSFYAWRRQIQQWDAAAFTPVTVAVEEAPASADRFEVVLLDGRTLRAPPGFDAAALRRLLALLEEVPSC